jgi:hypothetical protein
MIDKFITVLEDKQYLVERKEKEGWIILRIERNNEVCALIYNKEISEKVIGLIEQEGFGRSIIMGLNVKSFKEEILNKHKASIFDLLNKTVIGQRDMLYDEVREYLRKRGIRFSPILWRYKEGLG